MTLRTILENRHNEERNFQGKFMRIFCHLSATHGTLPFLL